jgi:Flp pilus assembly pilin Flp
MCAARKFSQDDYGAVTVDWVVMAAAVIAVALGAISQISGGVLDVSEGLVDTMASAGDDGSSYAASHFYDVGINAFPDDQTKGWRAAREAVADAAPTGYDYDPAFNETRYVDTATGFPIYESSDGTT